MKPVPVWPTPGDPADPYQDEAEEPDDGWADHCRHGGTLPRDDYAARVHRLRGRFDAIDAGRDTPDGALVEELAALQIPLGPREDRRTERPPAPWIPRLEDLVRLTTDVCPLAAGEAHDRVLGPFADEFDARDPAERHALLVSLAAYAFCVADGERFPNRRTFEPGLSPFQRWSRRQPQPPAADRRAVRAVALAPWSVWCLDARIGDRWRLVDLVGLGRRGLPPGPVRLRRPACLVRPPRPGDTLVARVLEGPEGWEAVLGLVIPGGPPARRVRAWVRLELARGRIVDRRLTTDQLLRRRGQVVARRLSEWAWRYGDDDPYGVPSLYDLEYADHREDLGWYQGLADAAGGPVLELGCGTGRLLLHLARAGFAVHGVDRSETMLAALAAKVAREPGVVRERVTWEPGDFTAYRPERRYPLVILPFNAVHHCRDPAEVARLLAVVDTALADGGRFALDCYLPDLALYDRDPDGHYEHRTFTDPRTGRPLHSWEQGWWDPENHVHHVVYTYRRAAGAVERSHLQLRMYALGELRALLARAGFRLLHESRDFGGDPLGPGALKYVAICARR